MTAQVSSLMTLLEIEDLRYPVLQNLPFEALRNFSATCMTFRELVNEHWIDRARRLSAEEYELARSGYFGKLPLTKLCRSLVISRDRPLAFERDMPMPKPPLTSDEVHVSMEGYAGKELLFNITTMPLNGSEFRFNGSISRLCLPHQGSIRLLVRVHSSRSADTLINSFIQQKTTNESGASVYHFLGQPIASASRFRVRAEASFRVTKCARSRQEKIVSATLRFVNTDCQTKVQIQDQDDILRILSLQLQSPRDSRALVRDQRASLSQVMFLVELGSESTTWCAQPAIIGPMGLCVIPDVACPSAQARRPVVDINAQVHVKVMLVRKSDGFMKSIMFTKVGSFDILSASDEQVLVLFKAQSEHPLKLEKFNTEKGGVLCSNCSVIHKFFACLNIVCAVKGHSKHGKYRVHPQDFVMYFEARALNCAHPVEKRVDFEEILMRLMSS
eukprot:c6246_g1_i2.p1 GENE.c6246_g1_i2~~c6246_g1_i2.p1  ORF type:complete len:459 (-),score=29.75 c6246_g1_i2:42-1376(-)